MTSLLFGMTILFCYIAWFLGYDGFVIVGDVELPWILSYISCAFLFFINMTLQTGFVMDWYDQRVFIFSIPLLIGNMIGSLFLPALIFTGFIPYILFIISAIKKHGWNKNLKWYNQKLLRPFFLLFVVLTHQVMVSLLYDLVLNVNISMYQVFRISISEILLMLLLYSIGGVSYERNHRSSVRTGINRANRLEFLVLPGQTRDEKHWNDSDKTVPQNTDDFPVNRFEVWVMRSTIAIVQIFQWMFILWICSLDNLFLDALVMTTSFICHGMIISKRKHLKPVILCTLAATAMFYFASRFTFSFQYSHFFPIFIGLVLVYTVYRISYEIETATKEGIKIDKERIEKLEEKVAEAWKQFDELM